MKDRETYAVGYSDHVTALFSKRAALHEAEYFARRLLAGMSVLDCGCGPGSITAGFADIMMPGRVVGVDIEPSQIEIARQRVGERWPTNCEFRVASVYELPFTDHTFDAAHMNAVLCQLKDPLLALAELKRVVKPGGLIGGQCPASC